MNDDFKRFLATYDSHDMSRIQFPVELKGVGGFISAAEIKSGGGIANLPPWLGKAIALVDLDAFFASVEQLDHPEWKNKPVIVGGDKTRRGVVSTCSYEARAFGVHSAMPSAQAARLCPQAIWARGNHVRYQEMSTAVMMILADESPYLEQVSIDEAFIDISPGRFANEHPIVVANRIQKKVRELGISCSIGLGTSKSVAKIASDIDKPEGLTIVYPGCESDFLRPLPIRKLSGIGVKAEKQLHELGIRTLGQLAQTEQSVLVSVFGKNTELILSRCQGLESSEVIDEAITKSVSNEMTFSVNLVDISEIRQAVIMLCVKVGRRLRRKQLRGYTLTLKVRFDDLSVRTARKTLDHAVDDEQDFAPVICELIGEVWQAGQEVRLIGVGVSSFEARPEQLSLFTIPEQSICPGIESTSDQPNKSHKRSLVEATDKVKNRFGENAVRYGRDLHFFEIGTGTIALKDDCPTEQH